MGEDLREQLMDIEEKLQAIADAIELDNARNAKQPCTDIPVAIVVLSAGKMTVTRKDAGFMLRLIDRDSVKPEMDTIKDVTTDYYIDDTVEYEGE